MHVDPDRAGRDAVQNEQSTYIVHGLRHGTQVVIGQNDPGSRLHVRRKDQIGPLPMDCGNHLVDRGRRKRRLTAAAHGPGLEHDLLGRDTTHLEDLRPAIAEPAVTDDQCPAARCELARHGLHAERAAARHDNGAVRAIGLLENAGDVAHHALEFPGHVIQRAVGEDDRVFEQAFGVDLGPQAWHGSPL